jgi:hypothetical protein
MGSHSIPSLGLTAVLAFCAGCGAPAGKTVDAGPTYCAQSVGHVDSCEANTTTGSVVQCGPQRPVCTPPNQAGGGVWACCSSTTNGTIRATACTITLGGPSDASCPCVGCGDAGQ